MRMQKLIRNNIQEYPVKPMMSANVIPITRVNIIGRQTSSRIMNIIVSMLVSNSKPNIYFTPNIF